MRWCITVGVVSDYAAVQSQTVMSLSHLDHISQGKNTCLCVCRRQSRHGNFDFIKANRVGEELGVWRKCTTVCSFTTCLWVCEVWKFNETNWWRMIAMCPAFQAPHFHVQVSFGKSKKDWKKSIDLSARMPSGLIIKELNELQADKGVWRGGGHGYVKVTVMKSMARK